MPAKLGTREEEARTRGEDVVTSCQLAWQPKVLRLLSELCLLMALFSLVCLMV